MLYASGNPKEKHIVFMQCIRRTLVSALKIEQLRTFVDVVELGTFTAAADRRGFSQPAVSLQVSQLERAVGTKLIERIGKKAMPTPAGSRFLDHCRRILEAAHEATEDMKAFSEESYGHVRIGTGATACIYLLPPALKKLREKFPNIEITMRFGNTSDILKLLEQNQLDLGFVTMPVPGRMFATTPVLDDPFALVASSSHLELPDEATPDRLANLPLISFDTASNMQKLVVAWFREAERMPTTSMMLGNVEAIKELVSLGLGYAILPLSALPKPSSEAKLHWMELSPRLSRSLAVVVRQDKPRTLGIRETMRFLIETDMTAGNLR
ncbi:MAG: LysR family transcriptional regulator [Pseudomonadota bacterium]